MTAQPAPQLSVENMKTLVKTLSSDDFEGRAPSTSAEPKVLDTIIASFKKAGLQPGNKGQWLQDVPTVEITGSNHSALTVTGAKTPLSFKFGDDYVAASYRVTPKTQVKDSELVFVGYGINAPELGWNDYAGIDMKGKTAVILVNDADYDAATEEGPFKGRRMTYYGRWTYKYEEGARQGALGVLIVHETAPASYGWATVAGSNTNTMFDVVRDNPAESHPLLEGWIQRDLAVELFRSAGQDFEALKKKAQQRDFTPVPLTGASLDAKYAVKTEVITSHNVAARLEGSRHPDETIIYSAHWDHIGVGKPDARGDRIFNGALDNASGTASLIELARGFAKEKRPQRSLLFLAVTAEEKGLLGSEYYATHPLYPLEKTVAVINMDGMAPFGPSRDFGIYGAARFELLDQLKDVAKGWDIRYTPDPKPEAGLFFRSDHFPFAKRGVPALSWSAGQDWVDGGVAAGKKASEDYTAKRYHQQGDEWQPDWVFAGAARDLEVLYTLGNQLANSRSWPNWSKDESFRAVRDASADQRK
ncbi:MAG TPA: peptidase M20 [Stenotrophomonas sp.]|nr:peptidase M20 [Stenotrophomonas sp.]